MAPHNETKLRRAVLSALEDVLGGEGWDAVATDALAGWVDAVPSDMEEPGVEARVAELVEQGFDPRTVAV